MCACAKLQQINQYKNNVVHFFFRVDPNRTNRLFQISAIFFWNSPMHTRHHNTSKRLIISGMVIDSNGKGLPSLQSTYLHRRTTANNNFKKHALGSNTFILTQQLLSFNLYSFRIMDVKEGHCWRCEAPGTDVSCKKCNKAKYCVEQCRQRDEMRHEPQCDIWASAVCSNPSCRVSENLKEVGTGAMYMYILEQ